MPDLYTAKKEEIPKEKGLTQEHLARKVDIPYITEYYRGANSAKEFLIKMDKVHVTTTETEENAARYFYERLS